MTSVLDDLRRRRAISVPHGEPFIQDVLRNHPDRNAINVRLFDKLTSAMAEQLRAANAQIRATRAQWNLQSSRGMLVYVNEQVDMLDPPVVGIAVERLLAKRTQSGAVRFPEIHSVILITLAHRLVGLGGQREDIICSVGQRGRTNEDQIRSFETRICKSWATFRSLPFRDGGAISPEMSLTLAIEGRKPPSAL